MWNLFNKLHYKISSIIFTVLKSFFPLRHNKQNIKYEWRGLMIDTVRHMPSLDYLKKIVDEMQVLDLNKLHLHLSDDQGFRVQIKKYPKLNTTASFRNETVIAKNFPTPWLPFTKYIGDGKKYGGFYTISDLKSLVLYAKNKGVEIIPEIDIPGHMTAILAAYPEFASRAAPSAVATYWGVFNNVISNSEESKKFLENIFDEIMDIFESDYVHIGGDEVSFENYKNGKHDCDEILLSVVNYLNKKNKKVILWDDAKEIALATNNTIMNWQNIIVVNNAIVICVARPYKRIGGKIMVCRIGVFPIRCSKIPGLCFFSY